MSALITFIVTHKIEVVSITLLVISEIMALIPGLKANGILAMIVSFLKDQGAVDPEK